MIPCKITVLESTLKVPEKHDICCWKSCFGEVAFVKLDCKTCLHTLIYVCTPCYFSMAIDNQLLCAQVEIYNSNWLSQFKCLNTNQVNETFFFSKFSNFSKITICFVLLAYFSVYPNLKSAYNYDFDISNCKIISALLIKFFSFVYHAFNLKCMFSVRWR